MPFDFKHALGPSISFNPLKPLKPGDIIDMFGSDVRFTDKDDTHVWIV